MMGSGSMIIVFSFAEKGMLCDSGGFVNNNPCEPKKFHIFFKKHITNMQFFPNIYQNVPVGSKDVKSMKYTLMYQNITFTRVYQLSREM
jgi:hypothetical protein